MARGVWELRESFKERKEDMNAVSRAHCPLARMATLTWLPLPQFYDFERLHNFLDKFYMSRIGIRILIGHYLALQEHADDGDWVGLVCDATSPAAIAEAAIEDATFVCTRQYGAAPDVTLHGRLDLTFAYVPRYVLARIRWCERRCSVPC
jgi:hypothetical protein